MQKWEYMFANFTFRNDAWRLIADDDEENAPTMGTYINTLGEQGWELVSHDPIVMSRQISVNLKMNMLDHIRTVFKRPKSE